MKQHLRNSVRLAALALAVPLLSSAADEPKADPAVTVTCGNARFTVLTDRLLRLEWSPEAQFEDRATLTFVNRRLPVPKFVVTRKGDGVTIETAALRLDYAGGAFASNTLSVATVAKDAACPFVWRYGDADAGNLMGTTRTLGGVMDRKSLDRLMEKGLLSRNGWTVVDDATNHLLVPSDDHWQSWVAPRDGVTYADGEIDYIYGRRIKARIPTAKAKDLYFFGYGHDYRGCLGDYVKVAGRIPLPPRWAFGFWWSRYWLYTDREIRDLIDMMKSVDMPIDVFVIDMEWHDTWRIADRPDQFDEFNQYHGWTGYTWNRRLFPNPKVTLDYLHARGCKVPLNLHPASGIQPCEEAYSAFAADFGWNKPGKAVPYGGTDPKWCDSYFKTVLGPLEDMGIDFWWLDWQQWMTDRRVEGLSNTFWLNHVFSRHMAERKGGSERPFIYHRWGGLGSHRYQVGFSGDTHVAWCMLEAIPWFTATSSNVGYGYWGHDIGGHQSLDDASGRNGELFTRWLQSGVFTPIFKIHSTKDPRIERRIWKYPEHFAYLREALDLRYRLAPYVYTAARQTYDTGVSMCRPMYYDSPECEAAYAVRNAYMFGDDILAVTVSHPADAKTGLADVKVWLPKGRWYDVAAGELVTVEEQDGREVDRAYAIDQNPWFVRAGAIIPMYPKSVRNLAKVGTDDLELLFAPGAENGACRIYEDDGTGPDYAEKGRFTPVARTGNRLTIGPRAGAYTLRFPLAAPFARVRVNGIEVPCAFDADTLSAVVLTPRQDGTRETVVELEPAADAAALADALNGLKGEFRRADALTEEYKTTIPRIHWAINLPDSWQSYWQTPAMLAAFPDRFAEILAKRKDLLKAFQADLARHEATGKLPAAFVERIRAFAQSVK